MAAAGELQRFCADRGIRLLVAFGSAVTDPGRTPRDVDLAVLTGDGPDHFELVADLTRLAGTGAVDVMDLGRAGVLARANALGWGVPLYEDEPGLFAREQMAALGQRMELGWLADLDLALLAGQ